MSSLKDCDELVRVSHIISSCPSILGGLFVALSFFVIPKIRTPSFYLILTTAMSDSLFSIAWLFPSPQDRTWQCRLQGWWMQFFPLFSVYLSLLTAIHIYLLIVAPKSKRLGGFDLVKWTMVAAIVALIGSVVPLISDRYGLIGKHCWIALDEGGRDKQVGMAHRLGLQYVEVWAICVVDAVLYYKIFLYTQSIFKRLTSNVSQSSRISTSSTAAKHSNSASLCERNTSVAESSTSDKVKQLVFRLMWYPVIMFMSWSGLILVRLYQFSSQSVPCWLMTVAINLINLQGFWNAIVFASNENVKEGWFTFFGEKTCCWRLCECILKRSTNSCGGSDNNFTGPNSLLPDTREKSDIIEAENDVEMRGSSSVSSSLHVA